MQLLAATRTVAWVEIDDVWVAAVAHAGYRTDDVLLIPLNGDVNGNQAINWARGVLIDDADERVAVASLLDQANGLARDRVRCAVRTDLHVAEFGALARHELEHARQHDRHPTIQRKWNRAVDLLIERSGGLPESNRLYNLIPMEADANAAGAEFVRGLFGDAVVDELLESGSKHGATLRRGTIGPLEDLSDRMKQFILVDGPAACDALLRY